MKNWINSCLPHIFDEKMRNIEDRKNNKIESSHREQLNFVTGTTPIFN